MGIVQDVLDRFRQLETEREPWVTAWTDSARYVLPDSERFDSFFSSSAGGRGQAMDTVVSEPVASLRGREIYDMTSLWAIDRGASGTLSLITPQTGTWHDVKSSDPFAPDPTDIETRWYEAVRDYLFAARGNPQSGFWVAHKAAMRSTWAFGTAVVFIENGKPGISSPFSYHYVPLSQCHLAANFNGEIDTNYRLFRLSACQAVQRFGKGVSAKTQAMADDPKKQDQAVTILHAVQPRDETGSSGNSNRDMAWASYYCEVQEKHLIGESGFVQFPFRVDHWQRNNTGPYAEGPISLAIADIKSINLLSKMALQAAQQGVKPPMATPSDGLNRLNLNPGAMNPGAMAANGAMLVAPLVTAQRPDFAEQILETKRNQIRTTLYVNLWQTLTDPQNGMTATEALIRNQEKGDLLGPVGSSLQAGLATQVDREMGILIAREAFGPGSPLEAPQSVQGRRIGVRFTSPLDRLRRLAEFRGMQEVWGFAAMMAQAGRPEVFDKLDADESIDLAQEILGAPRKIMTKDDALAQHRQQRQQAGMTQMATQMAQGAGDAGQSTVAAVDSASKSPAASQVLQNLSKMMPQQGQPQAPAGR